MRLLLALALAAVSAVAFADTFISKAEVERVFAMRKSEWEAYAPRVADPKWKVRLSRSSTGLGVLAFDPVTGLGLSVQPHYVDDKSPPTTLVVGSFYPMGKPPASLSASQTDVERKARRELGARYFVSARHVELPPAWEGMELVVTRPK
jgi:hypothetical protein